MLRPTLIEWLRAFAPPPAVQDWQQRLRRYLGALLGVASTGAATHLVFGPGANIPLMVAPLGASALLLFAVCDSPLAHPWSLMAGNLISAAVGVACAHWIACPLAAASVAVAAATFAMFALRCLHPPGGAVAVTAVLGGPAVHALGYGFILVPVAFQSAVLLSAALVFHGVTGHAYPRAAVRKVSSNNALGPSPSSPALENANTSGASTVG
jgi:CBS domain-containing membrane protein